MKRFTSKTQKIGYIGEQVAGMFLVKHGFSIIEVNYTKKIGEIDIVARKGSVLHFIEVKSVSRGTSGISSFDNPGFYEKTQKIRPEHQFHVKKFRRFAKTVQLYLAERHVSPETPWEIDLLTVYLDDLKRQGIVIPFWNVVF